MTNFAEQLAAAVEDYPDRPAVKLDERSFGLRPPAAPPVGEVST
jgi:hypothetical protein